MKPSSTWSLPVWFLLVVQTTTYLSYAAPLANQTKDGIQETAVLNESAVEGSSSEKGNVETGNAFNASSTEASNSDGPVSDVVLTNGNHSHDRIETTSTDFSIKVEAKEEISDAGSSGQEVTTEDLMHRILAIKEEFRREIVNDTLSIHESSNETEAMDVTEKSNKSAKVPKPTNETILTTEIQVHGNKDEAENVDKEMVSALKNLQAILFCELERIHSSLVRNGRFLASITYLLSRRVSSAGQMLWLRCCKRGRKDIARDGLKGNETLNQSDEKQIKFPGDKGHEEKMNQTLSEVDKDLTTFSPDVVKNTVNNTEPMIAAESSGLNTHAFSETLVNTPNSQGSLPQVNAVEPIELKATKPSVILTTESVEGSGTANWTAGAEGSE